MKMIFDQGLETERSLDLDFINEQPLQNTLIGSRNAVITQDSGFPDFTGFDKGTTFQTVTVVDGSLVVPIIKQYNEITTFGVMYRDNASSIGFSVNITLGYKESNT